MLCRHHDRDIDRRSLISGQRRGLGAILAVCCDSLHLVRSASVPLRWGQAADELAILWWEARALMIILTILISRSHLCNSPAPTCSLSPLLTHLSSHPLTRLQCCSCCIHLWMLPSSYGGREAHAHTRLAFARDPNRAQPSILPAGCS